jgi:Flp pilus assembly protein TadD
MHSFKTGAHGALEQDNATRDCADPSGHPCVPILPFARDRDATRAAVRRFTRRLQTNADDADAWHALGDALIRLGDRPAACTAFRNAVQLDARRAHSQRALGNLLFDSGQLDHALRCFASVEGR